MDTGELIYKAFVPTLKMMTSIGVGFGLAKSGIFPPQAAKGVSVVTMNVSLPALIFSSMVQAFTPENISSFGGLAWTAIMYELIGAVLGWIIREIFYVPLDFHWGIIVCGAMSNWVNVPTAIVQSVGNNSPFQQGDVELGIAYISVFSFVFCIVMFPLGLHKLCALDFQEANLNRAEPASFSQKWAERIAWFRNWRRRRLNNSTAPVPETPGIIESFDDKHDGSSTDHGEIDSDPAALSTNRRNEKASAAVDGRVPGRRQARSTSFNSIRPIPPTAPLDAAGINDPCPAPCCPTISTIAPSDPSLLASTSLALAPPAPLLPTCSNHGPLHAYHEPNQPSIAPSLTWKAKVKRIGNEFVKGLIMPVSIAVIVSIPCALIQPIKALFTPVPGWTGGRISDAPDGRPPLAWLLETATFIGGICIPAGLLLLGAGFARLKGVFRLRGQPIGAMLAMTFAKMVIMPVIGVFFVRNQPGVFPPGDRMLTFVCILLSGTPAAVNQLVITQLYNPEGTAHTLSRFLLIQYILMPVFSTALAAVALYVSIR